MKNSCNSCSSSSSLEMWHSVDVAVIEAFPPLNAIHGLCIKVAIKINNSKMIHKAWDDGITWKEKEKNRDSWLTELEINVQRNTIVTRLLIWLRFCWAMIQFYFCIFSIFSTAQMKVLQFKNHWMNINYKSNEIAESSFTNIYNCLFHFTFTACLVFLTRKTIQLLNSGFQ